MRHHLVNLGADRDRRKSGGGDGTTAVRTRRVSMAAGECGLTRERAREREIELPRETRTKAWELVLCKRRWWGRAQTPKLARRLPTGGWRQYCSGVAGRQTPPVSARARGRRGASGREALMGQRPTGRVHENKEREKRRGRVLGRPSWPARGEEGKGEEAGRARERGGRGVLQFFFYFPFFSPFLK